MQAPARPSADAPRGVRIGARLPVLLVPGWSDTARRLRPLAAALERRGWPAARVRRVDFTNRYGSNREHAGEIAVAADALLAETCEPQLDVVAHSMGGLAARLFALRPEWRSRVRRLVLLGTPHHGTWAAWLAWGEGGREMRPGSELLRELAAHPGDAVGEQPELVCLRSRFDLRVFPSASALLAGARDAGRVACTHAGMLRSRRVADAVAAELLRR